MSDHNEYAYPFDPTGSLESNLIENERHTINPPDWTDHYFIVPSVGPFFENGLVITHYPSGVELVDGVDYVLSYKFIEASQATARPVFGAISIYNRDLAGVLEITYQTIGGVWAINEVKAAEMLSNAQTNPRITTWEQVVDLPYKFPVIDHEWDLVDLVGASEMVEALDRITQALYAGPDEGGEGGGSAHLVDFNNPHQVTKDQVGLGNVPNFSLAPDAVARDAVSDSHFLTPRSTRLLVETLVGEDVLGHVEEYDNPHQVNKLQIGLGLVDNYPTADDALSIEATSDSHFMTPRGVRLAVEQLQSEGPLADHLADLDNPHEVDKNQVGLGSVENYPVASDVDAVEGTRADRYMTPQRTRQTVETIAGNLLDSHAENINNPHQVTKSQVGLGAVQNHPVSSSVEAIEGESNIRYMTPLRTREAIDAVAGAALDTHVNDTNNPHQVTKDQVGLGSVENLPLATIAQAQEGLFEEAYMSPLLVAAAINELTTKETVELGNVPNFGMAADQEAIDGVSDTTFMSPAKSRLALTSYLQSAGYESHLTATGNPHNTTKADVGLGNVDNFASLTQADLQEEILPGDRFLNTNTLGDVIDSLIMPEVTSQLNSQLDGYLPSVTYDQGMETLVSAFESSTDDLKELQYITLIANASAISLAAFIDPNTDSVKTAQWVDATTILVSTSSGRVLISNDTGGTWSDISTDVLTVDGAAVPVQITHSVSGFTYNGDTIVYLITLGGSGYVWVSSAPTQWSALSFIERYNSDATKSQISPSTTLTSNFRLVNTTLACMFSETEIVYVDLAAPTAPASVITATANDASDTAHTTRRPVAITVDEGIFYVLVHESAARRLDFFILPTDPAVGYLNQTGRRVMYQSSLEYSVSLVAINNTDAVEYFALALEFADQRLQGMYFNGYRLGAGTYTTQLGGGIVTSYGHFLYRNLIETDTPEGADITSTEIVLSVHGKRHMLNPVGVTMPAFVNVLDEQFKTIIAGSPNTSDLYLISYDV